MNVFDYSAQCEAGAAISGTIEAADTESAMKQLVTMGLGNIELTQSRASPPRRSMGREDFIFFNEQLASLAKTGICLDAGLRQLARDVGSPGIQRVLNETADDLERGEPLDKALGARTGQLPELYGSVIRAGVQSGQLAGTLLNLSHHLRLLSDTRRLIVEAVTYPLSVLVIALALFSFILAFIVPHFAEIFEDFDARLPGLTQIVIDVAAHGPQILIVVVIVVLLPVLLYLTSRSSAGGRFRFERAIHAIPVLGRLISDSIRSRFLRAAAFALRTGIPLPEALRLAADATASPVVRRDAELLAGQVEKGGSVFEACRSTFVIPPIFGYSLEVCAERDNLPEVLGQLARSYESRTAHSQSMLRSWLGPALIVVVGAVIAVCILAMFLPLVSLMNSVC